MRHVSGILCVLALSMGSARSETSEVGWSTVDGGGAMFTVSGIYEVSGTIGQVDAGQTMLGGEYSVTGGFWTGARVVPACPGDADGDVDPDGVRDVDQDDLDMVLFNYSQHVAPFTNGDIDGNGVVNQDDLDFVLFYYGARCP